MNLGTHICTSCEGKLTSVPRTVAVTSVGWVQGFRYERVPIAGRPFFLASHEEY